MVVRTAGEVLSAVMSGNAAVVSGSRGTLHAWVNDKEEVCCSRYMIGNDVENYSINLDNALEMIQNELRLISPDSVDERLISSINRMSDALDAVGGYVGKLVEKEIPIPEPEKPMDHIIKQLKDHLATLSEEEVRREWQEIEALFSTRSAGVPELLPPYFGDTLGSGSGVTPI